MAGNMKKNVEIIVMKEEIQEEIFPFCTVEDTCVFLKEEDVRTENTEVTGNAASKM